MLPDGPRTREYALSLVLAWAASHGKMIQRSHLRPPTRCCPHGIGRTHFCCERLTKLHFQGGFPARFLDGAAFPASLKDLCLGDGFNEGVEGVPWPPGLEKVCKVCT